MRLIRTLQIGTVSALSMATLASCSQWFEAEFLNGTFELAPQKAFTECLEFTSDREFVLELKASSKVDVVVYPNRGKGIVVQAALIGCENDRARTAPCPVDHFRNSAREASAPGSFRIDVLSERIVTRVEKADGVCVSYVNSGIRAARIERRGSTTPD